MAANLLASIDMDCADWRDRSVFLFWNLYKFTHHYTSRIVCKYAGSGRHVIHVHVLDVHHQSLTNQNRHLKSINPPKCRSSDSKSTKIGPGRPQKPQDGQRIRMVIPSSGFPWRSPAGCSTNGYLGGLWWLKDLCLVGIPFGAEIPMQKPPNLNHQPIVCWNGLWSLIWR